MIIDEVKSNLKRVGVVWVTKAVSSIVKLQNGKLIAQGVGKWRRPILGKIDRLNTLELSFSIAIQQGIPSHKGGRELCRATAGNRFTDHV